MDNSAGARLPSHQRGRHIWEAVPQRATVSLLAAQTRHSDLLGKPWLMAQRRNLWPHGRPITKSMSTVYFLKTKPSNCSFPSGNYSMNKNTRLAFISTFLSSSVGIFHSKNRRVPGDRCLLMTSPRTSCAKYSVRCPDRLQPVWLEIFIHPFVFLGK